jgi:hypothetical protein
MTSESKRLLQIGVLVIPVIAAAAGGKWAVDATHMATMPSATLPTPAELDSLRGYVVRSAPETQAPKPATSPIRVAGSDPFAKVARWETPKYSTNAGPIPARWVVSTIMITDNRRVAVINGVLASPGTVLPGGARVLVIEPDHVVLSEANGTRHEISVQGGAN